MQEEIAVSIACVTYNHSQYIRKTIEGFLMQKTSFRYEIIIHDDVSTDGTTEILKEYEKKYPDKIKLMLEEENQYSKGKRILYLIFAQVKGKYVALCDGDDEWTYEYKLQEQYELMEKNKNVSLCVHNALRVNKALREKILQIEGLKEGIINKEDVFRCSKGRFPTASMFFRAKYIDMFPSFHLSAPVGDEPIRFYCSYVGDVYYMDKVWAIRNYMHEDSWNFRMKNDSLFSVTHYKRYILYLKELKDYTKDFFEPYITELINEQFNYMADICLKNNDKVELLRNSIEIYNIETDYVFNDILEEIFDKREKKCIDYIPLDVKKFIEKCYRLRGKLYIYGAGEEAGKAAVALEINHKEYEGFVVSDSYKDKEVYMKHKVYELSELNRDSDNIFIWLCLNNENKNEVLPQLKKIVKYNLCY